MKLIIVRLSLLIALVISFAGVASAKDAAEPLKVDAALDRPVILADKDESVVVQIKIQPERVLSEHKRPPVNLCLVLDRSGSMQGQKIQQAIEAAQTAVERLGPRDVLSVITYSTEVDALAESQYATDKNRRTIHYALSEVQAGGGTAIYHGLNRGAAELRKKADEGYVNRIVLLSDGLANHGPSSVSDFRSLARAFAGEDIVVSTVGLGQGFNEDVMTTLAEAGQGNAYFVEDAVDLPRIFGAELGDALNVAATDIEIVITPREGVRIRQSLGREADIKDNRATFRLPQVYGGLDKLALLELDAPRGEAGETRELVDVEVRYVPANSEQVLKQAVSVPVAYSESADEIAANANRDVAKNVIDNRIVEAAIVAIEKSDAGENLEGAKTYEDTKDKIQEDYAMLGDDFLEESSEQLDQNADELKQGEYTKRRRVQVRAYEYQMKNQQSVKQ